MRLTHYAGHLPVPRNIHDGYCRSGDGCDRKAENGGRFCVHHQAELDRVKLSLGHTVAADLERMERLRETKRRSDAQPATRKRRAAYVSERYAVEVPRMYGPLLSSAPFASWLSRTVKGMTEFEIAQFLGMTTRNLRRLRSGSQKLIRRGTVERALTRWGRPDLFESLYPNA